MSCSTTFLSEASLDDIIHALHTTERLDASYMKDVVCEAEKVRYSQCNAQAAAVVPVYVTSFCYEDCLYCNFRRSNVDCSVSRVRLSVDDIVQETAYLVSDLGYRAIELVYATDPGMSVRDIARHITICRQILDGVGGGLVGINAFSLSTDNYRLLLDAGLDFAIQWQETYDRRLYKRYHVGTSAKCDFDFRYGAYDRMLQAGITNIGMGVLFGLAPWKNDFISLLEHETALADKYGIKPAIIGTARLKPAAGAIFQESGYTPSDAEMKYLLALHTLFSPGTIPWISTRESWDLCIELAKGGCLFTFDCSTNPGGYRVRSESYQFPTNDFPYRSYSKRIADSGLKPLQSWGFGAGGGVVKFRNENEHCEVL